MKWVILCANVWYLFASQSDSLEKFNSFPNLMDVEKCESPVEVTDSQIQFYASPDFPQGLQSDMSSALDPQVQKTEPMKVSEATTDTLVSHKKCIYDITPTDIPHVLRLISTCWIP